VSSLAWAPPLYLPGWARCTAARRREDPQQSVGRVAVRLRRCECETDAGTGPVARRRRATRPQPTRKRTGPSRALLCADLCPPPVASRRVRAVARGHVSLGLARVSRHPKPASRVIHAHHYMYDFQMWQESQNLDSDFTAFLLEVRCRISDI
jgi:hypothetical protein